MKLLLLIFFVLTTPFAVLLVTIFYGPITVQTIKETLSKESVYAKTTDLITDGFISNENEESKELETIIREYITPTYIQSKAELAIDDSRDWIVGETSIPPVISFVDLKERVLEKNPELLKSFEEMSADLEKNDSIPLEESTVAEESEQIEMEPQAKEMQQGIQSFMQSDFSIKLEPYLLGVKSFYSLGKITIYILLAFLSGAILFLSVLCQSWSSRFKWIGGTLFITGIYGFAIVFLNTGIVSFFTSIISSWDNSFVQTFGPVLLQIMKLFIGVQSNYLLLTSVTFLIFSSVFFILAQLKREKVLIPTQKNSPKKKEHFISALIH